MRISDLNIQQHVALQRRVKDAVVRLASDTELPTVRSLCRSLHLTQADLLQVSEDIGLNVNVGTMAFAGTADTPCKGDWTVECLNP